VDIIQAILDSTMFIFSKYLNSNGKNHPIKKVVENLKILKVKLEHLNQEPIIQVYIIKEKFMFLVDMEDVDIKEQVLMIYMYLILKLANGLKSMKYQELHLNQEEVIHVQYYQKKTRY
jgi:hypothetical protein